MNQYNFTSVTVSAPRAFLVTGNNIYYLSGAVSGSADPTLVIKIDGQQSIELLPGQGFTLPRTATHWAISPKTSGSSITGVLMIGKGEFTNDRVQSLSVEQSEILADTEFFLSWFSAGRFVATDKKTVIIKAGSTGAYIKRLMISAHNGGRVKLATGLISTLSAQASAGVGTALASSRSTNISATAGTVKSHARTTLEMWTPTTTFNYGTGALGEYGDIALPPTYASFVSLPLNRGIYIALNYCLAIELIDGTGVGGAASDFCVMVEGDQ